MNVNVTGRRVVATIIDSLLLGTLYNIAESQFGSRVESAGLVVTQLSLGANAVILAVVVAYYVLMEGYLGWTLGKRVMRIRVVDEATGRPPGPWKAVLRTLGRLIDGFFGYLVALIVVLSNSSRRRVGDMIAGTLVVYAPDAASSTGPSPTPPSRRASWGPHV